MMLWNHETKEKIQYIFSGVAFIFGLVLVGVSAFFIEPLGVVDATIITIFGLILSFVGGAFGISYHYSNQLANFKQESSSANAQQLETIKNELMSVIKEQNNDRNGEQQ